MVEKTCSVCNETKLLTDFCVRNKSEGIYRTYCKDCNRIKRSKYEDNYYKQNKESHRKAIQRLRDRNQDYIMSIKQNGSCIDCGESRWQCLDFDHIDQSKKSFSISQWAKSGKSLDKLKMETEKCVLRCANCHRVRTAEQMSWYKRSQGKYRC